MNYQGNTTLFAYKTKSKYLKNYKERIGILNLDKLSLNILKEFEYKISTKNHSNVLKKVQGQSEQRIF